MDNVDYELVRLTGDFTLHDWNIIRTNDHWKTRDSMPYRNMKMEFLLREVREYISESKY